MSDNESIIIYIYALHDPETKEVRYIGVTRNPKQRLAAHIRRPVASHKGAWVSSLLKRGLLPELSIIGEVSFSEWEAAEAAAIKKYQEAGARLTNATSGGRGMLNPSQATREKLSRAHKGRVVSEEARRKVSAAQKGVRESEEARRRYSDAQKGKVLSEETKRKMSEARAGHVVSEETRQKISLAHMGKPGNNKGKRHSEETKQKMRDAAIGRRASDETRKRLSEAHKGQAPSEETLVRRSASLKEAWRKRKALGSPNG